MAKRRIHLTEGQLYGLVEQTINETIRRSRSRNSLSRRVTEGNRRRINEETTETLSDLCKGQPKPQKYPRTIRKKVRGLSYDEVMQLAEKEYAKAKEAEEEYNRWACRSPFWAHAYYELITATFKDALAYWQYATYKLSQGTPSNTVDQTGANNESFAHRVTEGVIRKIRESAEDEYDDEYEDEGEDENSEFVEYLADAIYDEAIMYGWDEDFDYLASHPDESIPFNVKIKYQEGNSIIYGILKFGGFVNKDKYDIEFVGQNCRKKILDDNGNPISTEAYSLSEDVLEAVGDNLISNGREFSLNMWRPNKNWIYGY